MITFLSGKLVEKRPTAAIVEVQGIGYHVNIPTSSFDKLPEVGKDSYLFTILHVREDAMQLFGFVTQDERRIFETMLSVSGIGPKLALAALSVMSPADLRRHVVDEDIPMLTRIPGVGRKTAERMIVELKDRMAALDEFEPASFLRTGDSDLAEARADALAALVSLGFGRTAAEKTLRKAIKKEPNLRSTEDMIRAALREA